MSAVSKHFGLKYKEESYIFKELEKIRQETKKDLLRFKQKLASKPAVEDAPEGGPQAPAPKPSGPPGAAAPAAAPLPQAPRGAARPPAPSEAAAPGKTRPGRPQDFCWRSSAPLRHGPRTPPPLIASRAGTSRPLGLTPPPAAKERPRARLGPRGARSPRSARRPSPEPVHRARAARRRAAGRGRRGGAPRPAARAQPAGPPPRPGQSPGARGGAPRRPQPARGIPTSIEEVIASLQSEAQLASDQTVQELIQSVLGHNYDLNMEDISLMGKMYKTSQVQEEQGLQTNFEEPQMVKSLIKILLTYIEKLPEAISSIFQLEQEDMLEWGVSEAESVVFKPQETLATQPAGGSSKPLKDELPTGDSKACSFGKRGHLCFEGFWFKPNYNSGERRHIFKEGRNLSFQKLTKSPPITHLEGVRNCSPGTRAG
uniref:Uncharacterized protein n=1 Tax=Canis lupus familiaris TaxID=9615 RepID=A0A8C0PJV7_CANLF